MSKRSSKIDPSIFVFDEENESPIERNSESPKAEFVETTDYTDIDTSDSSSDSSDTEIGLGYESTRYTSSKTLMNTDETRLQEANLRKTLMENRKSMVKIRDQQKIVEVTEEAPVGPVLQVPGSGAPTPRRSLFTHKDKVRKFKAVAKTVALTETLKKATGTEMSVEVRKKFDEEENTVDLPSIDQIMEQRRRRAVNSNDIAEQDLRGYIKMQQIQATHAWILHPYSKVRFIWDILTVLIIVSTVVTIPLEFSLFNNKDRLDGYKLFTDIWFMLDIMLNFCTGIFAKNSRGTVVMDAAEIRKSYLKSWFILDLLATIPFDVIAQRVSSTFFVTSSVVQNVEKMKYLKMTRGLKVLKLLRFLRLGRFVRYLHIWEEVLSMDYGTGENIVKGVTWLSCMILVSHGNACIIYGIAAMDSPASDYPKVRNGTIVPADLYEKSWFYEKSFQDLDLGHQYGWCLFKSVSHMLTIGYGVNQPRSNADLGAAIWAMFSGALVFGLFLSQIISLIDQVKITSTKFARHVQEVDDYLRFNRCPKSLKMAVKEFYDFHYRQRIFDEDMIFRELNPILLSEVTTCGIIEYIQECFLFRTCRMDFQRKLCKLFKVEVYQPYTNIILAGRAARTFSIIRQGVVSCEEESSRRGQFYHLEEGKSFGLETFANIAHPRLITTCLSETWVEVIQMDISRYSAFKKDHPHFADEFKLIDSIADQELKKSGKLKQITRMQNEIKLYYG